MYNKIEDINENIIFIEVPLLFETDFKNLFDYIILAFTDKITQIERGIKRDNLTKEEIEKRISYQIDMEEKKRMSDYILTKETDCLDIIKILEA